MKTIKDSVHDHIAIGETALDIIDTPTVQRLRHIIQLGTAELVYPSANHTRFEHSLGVYHLAGKVLEQLDIKGQTAKRVRMAALLHDVGHGPYSHTLEDVIERETGQAHDEVEAVLSSGQLETVLQDHGLTPSELADLIAGDSQYGGLISGELDVDRMDYLVRDAHHTGVPYGTIDHGRLIRELRFVDNEVVLAEGNVQTAESLLIARALMNPVVYNHHVARIAKSMLRRAAERLLETETVSGDELRRMDDHDLFVALRKCDETAELADRITYRRLFKRAIWAEVEDVPAEVVDADRDRIREFESDIAARAGVHADDVIVDVQAPPALAESTTRVVVSGDVRALDEQSAIVEALRAAGREQWRFGVYTTSELTEPVGHAAERVLDLSTDGRLVTERRGRYVPLDKFGGDG